MPITATKLKSYVNPYFVETGTFLGVGIRQALVAGFPNVISIELSESLARNAQDKFRNYSNVHVICGDACDVLWDVISTIQEQITFWLDGHYSGGVTAKGAVDDPILQELELIARHPVKTHTILVDDMRLYGAGASIQRGDVERLILAINPAYKISLMDGHVKADILVAQP